MIGIVVDYSGGYPGAANLRAAGVLGAVRYLGLGSSGKRTNRVEVADFAAHGIAMWGVAESTTTEADNGYAAGRRDAQVAEADRIGLGLPNSFLIHAANDKPGFIGADVDYVRGFRDVLGPVRTGAYGFGDFLAAVHAAGLASAYWQAGHPPSMTGTSSFVNLWQRQGTWGSASDGPGSPTARNIGGTDCDLNNYLIPMGGASVTGPVDLTPKAIADVALEIANWGFPEKDGEPGGPGPDERFWVRMVKLGQAVGQVQTQVAQIAAAVTASQQHIDAMTAMIQALQANQAAATRLIPQGNITFTSAPPASGP